MNEAELSRLENKVETVLERVQSMEKLLAERLAVGELRMTRTEQDVNALGRKCDKQGRFLYMVAGGIIVVQFVIQVFLK